MKTNIIVNTEPNGVIQYSYTEGGKVFRSSLIPGQTKDLPNIQEVIDAANLAWTQQVIDDYKASIHIEPAQLSYADLRAKEYPNIGDQLDAILKGFNQLRLNGTDLPADLDSIVGKWLQVKQKYPKPE